MNSTVYLVVEPIEIIASDLAMNIEDYDPTATVLVALTHEAACRALKGHARVRVAFVHADPSAFVMTDLARSLDCRGAELVFTGDAAERNGGGVLVLHRPFSAQTTAALLQRTDSSETA
jgi:hypothetical protein